MMYRRILFAVEDDEALPAAIGAVAAYAGFWHAQVRVLHVHRMDPASRNGPGNGLVEAVVERLRAQGVDVEGETQSVKTDDQIAHAVAAVSARIQPDLLVVGSRGRSGVAGFVLGSVSHRIAAGLDVPVLVIRASYSALRPPRKVLVAVDDSLASDEALTDTAVVAARADAEVLVLHVQQMIAVQGAAIVEPEAQASAIVDRAVGKLTAHGVRARGRTMIDQNVAAAIVAAAERFEADLVVLGSSRPIGIAGVLLGSVGHEVVSRMRRPVLLARRVRDTEKVH